MNEEKHNRFQKKYNEDEEYIKIREKNSTVRAHYLCDIDQWKNKYLKTVLSNDIKVHSIMEVGCATGDLIGRFPSTVPLKKRYGIDISDKNIQFARKEYPDINFFCGRFEDFIKTNKAFNVNVIILSDIVEHVENDVELLQKAGNIADYILLNLPLEKCREFKNRAFGKNDHRGHLRCYDLDDTHRLIKAAGLIEIKSVIRYYVKSSIFRSNLRNKLMKNNRTINNIKGLFLYFFELLEILFRFRRYKSNYFALLTKK